MKYDPEYTCNHCGENGQYITQMVLELKAQKQAMEVMREALYNFNMRDHQPCCMIAREALEKASNILRSAQTDKEDTDNE